MLLDTNFGRIAAQTAKQVIIQGIRESERGAIYREFFVKRTGNTDSHGIKKGQENRKHIARPAEQIRGADAHPDACRTNKNEPIAEGQYIKVYLVGGAKGLKGPQLRFQGHIQGL